MKNIQRLQFYGNGSVSFVPKDGQTGSLYVEEVKVIGKAVEAIGGDMKMPHEASIAVSKDGVELPPIMGAPSLRIGKDTLQALEEVADLSWE